MSFWAQKAQTSRTVDKRLLCPKTSKGQADSSRLRLIIPFQNKTQMPRNSALCTCSKDYFTCHFKRWRPSSYSRWLKPTNQGTDYTKGRLKEVREGVTNSTYEQLSVALFPPHRLFLVFQLPLPTAFVRAAAALISNHSAPCPQHCPFCRRENVYKRTDRQVEANIVLLAQRAGKKRNTQLQGQ